METKWQVSQVTELQGNARNTHQSTLKIYAAGTLESNHFLQQPCSSGGSAAAPTPVCAPSCQLMGRHYLIAHSMGHLCAAAQPG